MKKTLLFITSLFSLMLMCQAVFAIPSNLTLTTIQQAQQYCPDPATGLLFKSYNPGPGGDGQITGSQNGIDFVNVINPTMHPQSMNSANIIQGAQFRLVMGMYGYISNSVITCLYTYTNYSGGPTYIGMRSNTSLPNN